MQLLTVNIQNIGHLGKRRQGDAFSIFIGISVDNVLLQTLTSHFLSSLIFLNSVQ